MYTLEFIASAVLILIEVSYDPCALFGGRETNLHRLLNAVDFFPISRDVVRLNSHKTKQLFAIFLVG